MFLMRWFFVAVVFLGAAHFLPGIHVTNFWTAFLAAMVLSIVNFSVRPILIVLTLPISILPLVLFAFVVNALMMLLIPVIVPGFVVDGFWWAMLLAWIVALVKLCTP